MKRRALVIGSPASELVRAGVADELRWNANDVAMAARLFAHYGFDVDVREGARATRDGILEGLERLIADTSAGDAAAVYYSGHGGRVRNTAWHPEHPAAPEMPRYHTFIVPDDCGLDGEFRGILSIELAHVLARLTERTPNITVVMDCCHSGGMMRNPSGLRVKAVSEDAMAKHTRIINEQIHRHVRSQAWGSQARPKLDDESNRWAVRLDATRSDQSAYELPPDRGSASAFTAAWVDAIERQRGRPVTWDAIFPRIRERVAEWSCGQLPGIAGPIHRILFSLNEAPAPGAVGLVRRGSELRLEAGRLLGIGLGDRFLVMPAAEHRADPECALGRVTVVEVTADSARVEIEHSDHADAAALGKALEQGVRAWPVHGSGPWRGVVLRCSEASVCAELGARLDATGTLVPCHASDEHLAVVEESRDSAGALLLCVRDAGDRILAADVSPDEAIRTLQRMQRAAVVRGLYNGSGASKLDVPFALRWGRASGGPRSAVGLELVAEEISEGEEIVLEIENLAALSRATLDTTTLYFTALYVAVDDVIELLTSSEPTAIALRAGEKHEIGYRAQHGLGKLCIAWPAQVPRVGRGRCSIVAIAADRPHDLRGLSTCDLAAYGISRTPALQDFATPTRPSVMRAASEATQHRPEMCYEVRRIDFTVTPGLIP